MLSSFFFFQAEDGIRDLVRSRGLGDVYKRQRSTSPRGSSSRSMTEGRVHRPRPWSSTGAGMPRGPAVPGPSSACAATRPPRCSPSKAPPRSWPRSCAKTDAPSSSTRGSAAVSYTHLRAHETVLDTECRLLLEKKKQK